MAIATIEPAVVRAGDTIRWQRLLPDYPASSGWALKYRLINAAGKIDITASPDGDAHLVSVSSADSAAWAPGEYVWQAYVEKTGERHTIGEGRITVKPDLAAMTAGYDARGAAQKALDDLKAALRSYVASSGHVSEYEIGGAVNRRMRFRNAAEIEALIRFWEREVAREEKAERLAQGLDLGNRILVRL